MWNIIDSFYFVMKMQQKRAERHMTKCVSRVWNLMLLILKQKGTFSQESVINLKEKHFRYCVA